MPPSRFSLNLWLILVVGAVLAANLPAAIGAGVDSAVVFNEVQYHPLPGGAEWVELHSLSGVNVDVGGWKLSGGIDYTFPAGTTVAGHGYLVVAGTGGAIPGALGPFTGQLNNSGDTIRLVNKTGRIMDQLTYSDSGD